MVRHRLWAGLAWAVAWCSALSIVEARDWYVDNVTGDEAYDGRTPKPAGGYGGPTRSIGRALQRVSPGDSVIVTNTGIPYFESLHLVGGRCSGFLERPLTIAGNGAVLSGARELPPRIWNHLGNELWEFSPRRKGYYALLNGGVLLPEDHFPHDGILPRPAPGHWAAWRGSIYYQSTNDPRQTPLTAPLQCAADEVGFTLLDVSDVLIRDFTILHYRLDGVNAHDRCRNVVLGNVRMAENGRSGLAVNGTSSVTAIECDLRGNRTMQLLTTEHGHVELTNSKLGTAPGIPFQGRRGSIWIDGQAAE